MSRKTKNVEVAIDFREPPEVVNRMEAVPWVKEVTLQELPAGDIVIGDVVFERKTWSDFVSTMTDTGESNRSHEDQIAKMLDAYETAYMLIEGDLSDTKSIRYSNMSYASVVGSAASITARKGVPVIPTSDLEMLCHYAVVLARKHIEDPSPPSIPSGVAGRDAPTSKKVYGVLPGVGPELSSRMYQEWPDAATFFRKADTDSLTKVEGIGEKRAEKILTSVRNREG